jgi:hypothetical protein
MPKNLAVEKSKDQLSAQILSEDFCSKFLEHSDSLRIIQGNFPPP